MRLRTQLIFTSISKSTKQFSVLILAIFLTRHFTTSEYGSYLQVMLLANIGTYFVLFGIPSSIYYFFPRINEKRSLIKTTQFLLIAIAVVTGFTIYFLMPFISSSMNNGRLIDYAGLIAAFIIFQIPIKIFEPFMITSDNVGTYAITEACFNIGFLLSVLIPVLLDFQLGDILRSLFYFYVVQFLTIYAIVWWVYQKIQNAESGEPYLVKKQLFYGVPVGISSAVLELSAILDRLIISGFFSPSVLAIYARGAMDIPVLGILSNTMNNILMPRFVAAYQQENYEEVIHQWHISIRFMTIAVYPAFVFFILTANHLIPFLFTDLYQDSVIIFQIYTLGYIFKITSFDVIARTVGQTHVMLKFSLITLSLKLLLLTILIQMFGVIGAPVTRLIILVLFCYLHLSFITKVLNIRMAKVFPWKSLAKILMASLVSALVTLPLQIFITGHFFLLASSGIVFAIAYLACLRVFGSLNFEDKKIIREIIPKRLRWVI